MVVSRAFDLAGRLTSETKPNAGTTTISYDVPNRTTTTTYADGGTRIETLCKCGTLKVLKGTAKRYDPETWVTDSPGT